jgi:hypothetical protein
VALEVVVAALVKVLAQPHPPVGQEERQWPPVLSQELITTMIGEVAEEVLQLEGHHSWEEEEGDLQEPQHQDSLAARLLFLEPEEAEGVEPMELRIMPAGMVAQISQ